MLVREDVPTTCTNPHEVLGGEPGLMELVLAMGAHNTKGEERIEAVVETCRAVSSFLCTSKQSQALDQEPLWQLLLTTLFPDAPEPPDEWIEEFAPSRTGLTRAIVIEMHRRYQDYLTWKSRLGPAQERLTADLEKLREEAGRTTLAGPVPQRYFRQRDAVERRRSDLYGVKCEIEDARMMLTGPEWIPMGVLLRVRRTDSQTKGHLRPPHLPPRNRWRRG